MRKIGEGIREERGEEIRKTIIYALIALNKHNLLNDMSTNWLV